METRQLTSFRAFINRHAVLTYFILVFALVWGLPLIIIIIAGPGALLGTGAEADIPRRPTCGVARESSQHRPGRHPGDRPRLWQGGPARPAIAVVPVAGGCSLVCGRTADRPALDGGDPRRAVAHLKRLHPRHHHSGGQGEPADLRSCGGAGRLLRRDRLDGVRDSRTQKAAWTAGDRTPRGRAVVPVALAALHGNCLRAVPQALSVAAPFFWWLPYRVLMVWVYDHTQSVLMAVLMHLVGVACAFVLLSSAMVGVPDLIFNLVFGATLWVFVASVAAADRRKLARGRHACHSTHTR